MDRRSSYLHQGVWWKSRHWTNLATVCLRRMECKEQCDEVSSLMLNILAAISECHAHWLVARRSSGCLHLDKAVEATRTQAQPNDAYIYIVSRRDVSIEATINLGAQSCLHVSPILLGSTQLLGTCGEMPLRGPWCLGRT